jgi:tRNA modification GTPase
MNDTILALATPPGTSALAVIRLSGPSCHQVWLKFLSKKEPQARMAKLLPFKSDGETLDQILAIYFAAPSSFTGEDSIELFPHGNMLLIKKIINALILVNGVRMAEPGEFTRRAFEHGQIDLIQAESIGMLIHSRNEKALENAQKLLKGELSEQIKELVDQVQYLSAKMELEVDFAEEEADAELDAWSLDIIKILELIDGLKEGHIKGRKKSEVPMVVLYGKPNAGKSSLINALLKEDRLLVSTQAGTTRDYIETTLYLDGGEIKLVDTAGLGEAVDHLDELSQEKTQQIVKKAHLRLHLIDGAVELNKNQLRSYNQSDVAVLTKLDKVDESTILSNQIAGHQTTLGVSSQSGVGLSELKEFLNKEIFEEDETKEEVWMASERQFQCLVKSEAVLRASLDFLALGHASPEILAFELREARLALEEITGEISVDSILGRIFEGFCIGK